MKVQPSVKPICAKCKVFHRGNTLVCICTNKKHKQRQG